MCYPDIETIFPRVEKPSRYIGGEVNSVTKPIKKNTLRFALAFPDTYEVGMSHLGLQILYSILNEEENVAAERVYAPWPDMEAHLRRQGIPLCSLETASPLAKFDIVGFSLQYELSYTNVLAMLDLGGIPLRASNRVEGTPIVIAGGPCVFNPEPMAPFIDAFVVGEGEEAVREVAEAVIYGKGRSLSREMIIESLSEIEGIYVPAYHCKDSRKIKKRVLTDLDEWSHPLKPVVPVMNTIHNRVALEIARGCTAGCRFCQPGMVWRPTRERGSGILEEMADQMIACTGYDEISLLSLSSGDYSCIGPLISSLMKKYYESRVALALPSLRVETLTPELVEEIKRVRKTSFTLAPEAGTQRLRNVINKGNTEEDLLRTADMVYDAGWRSIKLYFMLGLPTETDEDLMGIADLAHKVLGRKRGRRQVTVSLSTFVPKPHTPFQWEKQIDTEETDRKQKFFMEKLKNRNINLKWHDRRMSFLEGILSRGDVELASLIEGAYRRGCRFDGWGDQLRFEPWLESLKEFKLDSNKYMGERNRNGTLPWDHIDSGVTKAFLLSEREKAFTGKATANCRFGGCVDCGVCNGPLKVRTAEKPATSSRNKSAASVHEDDRKEIMKCRVAFSKRGKARFLSHLELSASLFRGMVSGGLRFVFSEGFHPHPRVSFPYATPVGVESLVEYMDIQIYKPGQSFDDLICMINGALPSGVSLLEIKTVTACDKSLVDSIRGFRYEMHLPKDMTKEDCNIEMLVERFLMKESFLIERVSKGKVVSKDIRPLVESLSFDDTESKIVSKIRFHSRGGVNPKQLLIHVLGLNEETVQLTRILKTKIFFSDRDMFDGKRDDF